MAGDVHDGVVLATYVSIIILCLVFVLDSPWTLPRCTAVASP